MQRAARRADGLELRAARVRHAAHHTPANGRRSVASGRHCVANAATGCNSLRSVATDGTALQPVALLVRCSGRHCGAIIAATGCNGPWSVGTGCGLLQRAVVCCNELWSVAIGRTALQHVRRCSRLGCATAGCTAMQEVAALWYGALLQQAMRCCNGWDKLLVVATCAAPQSSAASDRFRGGTHRRHSVAVNGSGKCRAQRSAKRLVRAGWGASRATIGCTASFRPAPSAV